jgi:formylglycine-generating enzyme
MAVLFSASHCGAPGPSQHDAATFREIASDEIVMDVVTVDVTSRDVVIPRVDVFIDRVVDVGMDAVADVRMGATCPAEMTLTEGRVCVDRWEAALEMMSTDGGVKAWSPYRNPGSQRVRAVSRGGQVPQGYISGGEAQTACRNAGKRLCRIDEWMAACRGPTMRTYPYGNTYVTRRCNEARTPHPVVQFYGTSVGVFTTIRMNNPGINMQANTVAPTGMFSECVSPLGAYDMVGNLHEWIDDSAGTFKGGFYVDAEINGHGCLYTTRAHALEYRDYSTGFRCCMDPRLKP